MGYFDGDLLQSPGILGSNLGQPQFDWPQGAVDWARYRYGLETRFAQPDPLTQDLMDRFQGGSGILAPDQRRALEGEAAVGFGGTTGPVTGVGGFRAFTGRGSQLLNTIRDTHLSSPDALPLTGATAPVTPPPHIRNLTDFNGLVRRYADLAQEGSAARDWYNNSGDAIYFHAGDNPQAADAFAFGLARTSPSTDVAGNALHAVKAHNQGILGEPIQSGRFPNAMGEAIESHYYGGEPISGEKIGPFMGAQVEQWNPSFSHQFVNDGWNMTALEYPRDNPGAMWGGTPTAGQHNFARIVADAATRELEARTGIPWSPKQAQAASWTAIKARTEGTPLGDAGFNFADGLARSYGQISYESAPGLTSGHLPEFHTADPAVQQAFHDAVNRVLVDPQGRDIISKYLGMLTGRTLDGPGVFEGRVVPGSQAQVALGQAPGGALAGVDQASKTLVDASSAIRAMLLRQDAAAWHKPAFVANLRPAQSNMIDVGIGRPLTQDEAETVTQALKKYSGSDFFSPISTHAGFRVMNVPEVSGIENPALHDIVDTAVRGANLPDATSRAVNADGGYVTNDWRSQPHGQGYQAAATGGGRPHLQRAAQDLFTALGPRLAQVEDDFARRYGWTPNRATRFWEQPQAPAQAPVGPPLPQPYWRQGLLSSALQPPAGPTGSGLLGQP